MRANDLRVSEHFKLREFECPCCKTVRLSPLLLEKLERLREIWQKPIILTSGYRCETRNTAVGGALRSRHRIGEAADVKVTKAEQEGFRTMAEACGFGQIILYGERGFVHLGV